MRIAVTENWKDFFTMFPSYNHVLGNTYIIILLYDEEKQKSRIRKQVQDKIFYLLHFFLI